MTATALFLAWVLAVPPPGDAYRLPPPDAALSARLFAQHHCRHLRERLEWEPYHRGELRAALVEAESLYEVWDCVADAQPTAWRHPDIQRAHLDRLRLLLGRDAYLRMELPPPVPLWRFNQLER